jgi:hypothetical protein
MQKNQKIKAVRRGESNKLKIWFISLTLQNRLEERLVAAFKKLHEPYFLNAI